MGSPISAGLGNPMEFKIRPGIKINPNPKIKAIMEWIMKTYFNLNLLIIFHDLNNYTGTMITIYWYNDHSLLVQ